MAEEIGSLVVKVGLDGSNFDKGLKNLNAQMNLAKSEMRAMGSSFDKSGKSIDALKFKQDGLAKQYKIQGERVQELKKQYDDLVAAHGAESDAALRAGAKLNNAIGSYENMGKKLQEVSKELAFQESKWGKATRGLDDFAQRANQAGDKMIGTGKTLSKSVTLPILGLGAAAIKTGADFQAQMSKVQAISGATGDDFEALKEQAKQLGRDTVWSASEAGEGMEKLALAGWKTKDIMSAMPGMLDLASAGALDLATAADITSDTMQSFEINAKNAGHAADVFAYAQANANTNVEQMGEAMKYAAPTANSLGWTLEETSAIIMKLADNGLKGSMATQAFGTSLVKLSSPTPKATKLMKKLGMEFFDAHGKMKSMPEVVAEMEKGLKGMSEEQRAAAMDTLIGKNAYKQWQIVLKTGSKTLAQTTKDLENADGTASKMAKTMNDNAKGAVKEFMSAVENLSIVASENLLPAVTDAIKYLTKLTRGFANMSPASQKTIMAIAGIAAAIGPLNLVFGSSIKLAGKFAGGLATLVGSMGRARIGSQVAATSIASFGGATAAAGGTVMKSAGAFSGATKSIASMGKSAGLTKAALGALGGPIGILTTVGLPALVAGGALLVKQMREETIPALDSFGNKVSNSTTEAVLSYKKLNDEATVQLNEMFWSGAKITQEGTEKISGLFNTMSNQIAESMETKFNDSYKTLSNFLSNSKDLTKKEQENILESMKTNHEKQKAEIQNKENRVKEIMNKASKEKRSLTDSERKEINRIQNEMMNAAVSTMSKSEKEQKAIMSKLKNESAKITARQAADTVKNSQKAKTGAVKEANDKYNKTVSAIIKERDETGSISAKQADKLIKEAKRQRDKSVSSATDMHKKVVSQAKKQAKGHVHEVNWTTGEVNSNWDMLVGQTAGMVNDISSAINWVLRHIGLKKLQIPMWKAGGRAQNGFTKHATGTGSHPGGPAILGDGRGFNAGPELVRLPSGQAFLSAPTDTLYPNLPKGTEVLPAYKTKTIMQMVEEPPQYKWGIGKLKKAGKAINNKVLKPIGHGIKTGATAVKDTAVELWDKTGKAMINLGLKAIGALKPNLPGVTGKMIGGAFDYLIKKGAGFLDNKKAEATPSASGSAKAWSSIIKMAAKAMGETLSASELNGIIAQIQRESGGNEKIIQSSAVWDVNTAAGNPARGLLQYIPQTFAAYRVPGHGNIYSGYDQLLAFFNNKNWRKDLPYGRRGWGPTGGRKFSTGGLISKPGIYQLAEDGYPEWVIPTDPARHDDAIKLLQHASNDVGNKRPNQLPNINDSSNNKVAEKLDELISLMKNMPRGDINFYDKKDSPSESARKVRQAQRQWAMGWR